MDHMSDETHS